MSVSATPFLTTAAVADHYGVGVDKVLRWIAAGELRALNVAASPEGRPRWRIEPADLRAFEERREAKRAQE